MQCTLPKTHNLYSIIKNNGIHTTHFLNGSRQAGNAMKKVMGATRKRKLHFSDAPKMPTPEVFSKGSIAGKHSGDSRRVSVLNKLFMRYVTDLMATGECSSEILGHGIEINRVQVTPDYNILKVYWIAKSAKDDADIEKILLKSAGFLRHELSQLRVMGNVPIIHFVKDKLYAQISELNNRLLSADFGPDHTPLEAAEKLKTEFEVLLPLEDNIKERLKKLDSEECEELEDFPLPSMPHNVLGLQHADILDRVKKSMKKSEAPHRHDSVKNNGETWASFKVTQSINEDPVQLGSSKSQRMLFKEFLHKRELLRLKAKCMNKNDEPDLEYIREELRERQKNYLDNLYSRINIAEKTQEDFIIEDVDEKTV